MNNYRYTPFDSYNIDTIKFNEDLIWNKYCKNSNCNNDFITLPLYRLNDTQFIFDLPIRLINELLSNNSQILTTLDSVEAIIDNESPALFSSLSFSGTGCGGVSALISPDKKSVSIIYPNFLIALSSPDIYELEYCTSSVILDITDLSCCQSIILNLNIFGQLVANNNSSMTLSIGSNKIRCINGPYANNYEANVRIKLILPHCIRNY